MPLDNFDIVSWASHNFAGLPAALTGGVGVLFLALGAFALAMAFRVQPTSWSLAAVGLGLLVLTYYVVGAAIATSSAETAANADTASTVNSHVSWAAGLVCVGLAGYGVRLALQTWSGEGSGAKPMGAIIGLAALVLVFTGVQIVRGARADIPATVKPGPAPTPQPPSSLRNPHRVRG